MIMIPYELIHIIFEYADYGRVIKYNPKKKKDEIIIDESHSKFKAICDIYRTYECVKTDNIDTVQYQVYYEIKPRLRSIPRYIGNLKSYKSYMVLVVEENEFHVDIFYNVHTMIESETSWMVITGN